MCPLSLNHLVDLRKEACRVDTAVAEGLLSAALWLAGLSGWNPKIEAHARLRILLTDLLVTEKQSEYKNRRQQGEQCAALRMQ